MYWGQILFSLFVAIFAAVSASERLSIPVFLLVYVGMRVLMATSYRTNYWFSRGTRGIYYRQCPNCNRDRYRKSGDWILRCHRCGWVVGLPAVRWLIHSVPSVQLRRSMGMLRIAVIVVAVVLIVGPITVTPATFANGSDDVVADLQNADPPVAGDGESDDSADEFDEAAVRERFVAYLNDERRARGLQSLSLRPELTAMGEEHADNMARHDYIGHQWPDGTTIQDRYENRGLLPECRLPIQGSDRFYPGAENAAGAHVDQTFVSGNETYHVTNEDELAQALVDIWMNSPPHRKAMLVYSADEMGLGIHITDQGKVYAALELC